jgi:DNA-directed RNA polymerase specialized sigma24 family protein
VDTPAGAAPLPADGEPEELARAPGLDAAVRGLLGRVGEGREALELLAVEELTASEAKGIIGEPAAVVERRASLAFAELVERLVSG